MFFTRLMMFIKRFFIKSNELSCIRHHIFYTIVLFIMMFVPDVVLNCTGRTNIVINQFIVFLLLLFCALSSFTGCIVKCLTLLSLFLTQIVSVNYVIIAGQQIESFVILQALKNIDVVFDNFSQTWWLILVILLPFVFLVVYSILFRKQFLFSFFSIICVLSIFGYLFYSCALSSNQSKSYSKPTRMIFYNNANIFPYFLTHLKEKPYKVKSEFTKANDITNNTNKKPNIIVLVLADNIGTDSLSLFNKKLHFNTTPRLSRMINKDKKSFFLSNSISSAFDSNSSLTKLFHLLYTGANVNEIVKKQKQSLFELAKKSGYKTHWIGYDKFSTLEKIGIYADDIKVAFDIRYYNNFAKWQDDYLIDLFRGLELNKGKHFVVIHTKTATKCTKDGDYITNYKHHGEAFAEIKNEQTGIQSVKDSYENSIIYLDYLIESFLEIAKRKNVDYLFFTSSTGIDIDNLRDVKSVKSLNVPFISYTKEQNIGSVEKYFQNIKLTQYTFDKYIAWLLGYDITNYYEENDKFYISNDIFDTNDTHILINIDKKGIVKEELKETLSDYYKRNKEKYKQFALKPVEKKQKVIKQDKKDDNKEVKSTEKSLQEIVEEKNKQNTKIEVKKLENSGKKNNKKKSTKSKNNNLKNTATKTSTK